MSKTFKPHKLLGVPCANDPRKIKCAMLNGCRTFFRDISGACAPLGASNARYTVLKTEPVHENNWVLPMYGTKWLHNSLKTEQVHVHHWMPPRFFFQADQVHLRHWCFRFSVRHKMGVTQFEDSKCTCATGCFQCAVQNGCHTFRLK